MEISKADIKFIKGYSKQEKEKKDINYLEANKYDIKLNQANLRAIQKVNKETGENHQYKIAPLTGLSYKHRRRIYSFLPNNLALELEGVVKEVNEFAQTKPIV